MGGEKETFVSQSKSKETTLNKYRIHLNNSEMHVHDDEKKLKFAMPIAKAWKMWDKISTELASVEYVDTVNKTLAIFELLYVEGVMNVDISIRPIGISDNYKKLAEFFKR